MIYKTLSNLKTLLLVMLLAVLGACNPYAAPTFTDDLEPLFTDADIDRAELQLANSVSNLLLRPLTILPENFPPLMFTTSSSVMKKPKT